MDLLDVLKLWPLKFLSISLDASCCFRCLSASGSSSVTEMLFAVPVVVSALNDSETEVSALLGIEFVKKPVVRTADSSIVSIFLRIFVCKGSIIATSPFPFCFNLVWLFSETGRE